MYTDSDAVRYLFCKTDPNQRLQRWVLAVQEFQFRVHHLPCRKNTVADVLSRYPPQHNFEVDEVLPDQLFPAGALNTNKFRIMKTVCLTCANTLRMTIDPKLNNKASHYRLFNGHLYRLVGSRSLMIPFKNERTQVLTEVHDGHAHFGQEASWKTFIYIVLVADCLSG